MRTSKINLDLSDSSKCKQISGKEGLWITVSGTEYPCASTTRYYDGTQGACGCGKGDNEFPWQHKQYSAAASPSIFSTSTEWCGKGCGHCYEITPTGYSPDGDGTENKKSITIMITDLCPIQGNEEWCKSPNKYGYTGHFDLVDYNMNGLITKLGWDNPEVYYKEVECTADFKKNWKTCECFGEGTA